VRIIGIDPGLAICGYCILDVFNTNTQESFNIAGSGSIKTSKTQDESSRLFEIHADLEILIEKYKPDVAAVEKLFYFKNAKTVMPVSMARGVIVMTFAKYNIPVYEYTPLVVKQTITGYGKADKAEIAGMIQIITGIKNPSKLDDTTDAIAIALCHSRQGEIFCKTV
jgi:crossover junction endodeoxyribonuclease RuvC